MSKITKSDLLFDYPQGLVALRPKHPPRVLFKEENETAREISFESILDVFDKDDLLIINKTKVLPRRIFVENFDVLFLESSDLIHWTVLFPAKKTKVGDIIQLPDGLQMTLLEKGLPQKVKLNQKIDDDYFLKFGSFALPPYIQQARGFAEPLAEDKLWYQTAWADQPGSLAAPTASLHFSNEDMVKLKTKINISEVTLHVGLGTFLPVSSENLEEHQMHSEVVVIPEKTIEAIERTKKNNKRIWALGTTSLRSIESWSRGYFKKEGNYFVGETDLFLKPGDEFQICNGLLTNFHQPGSTLMALVSAFSSLEDVKQTYQFAIKNKFRLFSYGDLSIWKR